MRSGVAGPSPGHILITVVPYLSPSAAGHDVCAMLNTIRLNQIATFVQELASPVVRIEVRNPVYEQIQIRCTVKVAGLGHPGVSINRLDHALSEYISPWRHLSCKARFGWCIRREDVVSYIRQLDYIEFVTNVSMLHITQGDEGTFRLDDTARDTPESAQYGTSERNETDELDCIRPRYPWSLPIPLTHHFIETTDTRDLIDAEMTGINELEIGSTFIMGQKEQHG
jgi:hypothetical protein